MTDDPAASTADPELLDVPEVTAAVIRDRVTPAELRDFFDRSFRILPEIVAGQGARIEGPAFCVYREESDAALDLEVGFAVDRGLRAERGVRAGCLPAGRVARIVHAGGFDGLAAAWADLRSWIEGQGLAAGPLRWEVYSTRPAPDMDPAELRTELNWPVAGERSAAEPARRSAVAFRAGGRDPSPEVPNVRSGTERDARPSSPRPPRRRPTPTGLSAAESRIGVFLLAGSGAWARQPAGTLGSVFRGVLLARAWGFGRTFIVGGVVGLVHVCVSWR